ncbi:MAG: hypothetical protein RMJ98_00360 [Myxococcales bacterium]|nr:hypothetical protein [Polyangiaceae bacterium]MDW8247739.1 hypothetical protein [Myxococcales bacterium]
MVRAWSLGILVLALVTGCDDLESRPVQKAARPVVATVALYGPQQSSPLAPFSSDRYLVADAASGRRVVLDASMTGDPLLTTYPDLVVQLGGSDGCATVGGVAVTFSGELDPSIVDLGVDAFTQKDAPFMLINVDEASLGKRERLPLGQVLSLSGSRWGASG